MVVEDDSWLLLGVAANPLRLIWLQSQRLTPHFSHCTGLSFAHQPNSPLLLIGSYALIRRSISFHDSEFTDFPFENLPKPYQQYSHEKTASEIFNVLKAKSKSEESLA